MMKNMTVKWEVGHLKNAERSGLSLLHLRADRVLPAWLFLGCCSHSYDKRGGALREEDIEDFMIEKTSFLWPENVAMVFCRRNCLYLVSWGVETIGNTGEKHGFDLRIWRCGVCIKDRGLSEFAALP